MSITKYLPSIIPIVYPSPSRTAIVRCTGHIQLVLYITYLQVHSALSESNLPITVDGYVSVDRILLGWACLAVLPYLIQ
jgi:hypothetical protein